VQALRIISVLLSAILLVPAGAHVASIANKLKLEADQYLAAQRAYDGWSYFGVPIFGLGVALITLGVASYRSGKPIALVLTAFASFLLAQAIFWAFTYPVNKATSNWTMLPDDWEAMRMQWEWSHAGGAVFTLAALVFLLMDLARS
jgi:hypothetical protein